MYKIYTYIYIIQKTKFFTDSAQYMLIERLQSGINETKQRDLELLVSCLYNHSANLQLL